MISVGLWKIQQLFLSLFNYFLSSKSFSFTPWLLISVPTFGNSGSFGYNALLLLLATLPTASHTSVPRSQSDISLLWMDECECMYVLQRHQTLRVFLSVWTGKKTLKNR